MTNISSVFISYSRRDISFVKTLHHALTQQNRDVWVDWEDIPIAADWRQEIKTGIEEADTFIAILSSSAVASKFCRQEVEYAIKHQKRLIPVVYQKDFPDDQVPPALRKHNWLSFAEDDFDRAFQKLTEALDTDLEYVRQHKRLLMRAIEWDSLGRNDDRLLRGSDLETSILWLAQAYHKTPEPTELQRRFILASQHWQQQEIQRWKQLYEKAEIAEIDALTSLSKALFLLNDQLGSLVASVKAGWKSITTELPPSTQSKLVDVLWQVAYGIQERKDAYKNNLIN